MSPHRLLQPSRQPLIQPNWDNSNNGLPASLPLLPRLQAPCREKTGENFRLYTLFSSRIYTNRCESHTPPPLRQPPLWRIYTYSYISLCRYTYIPTCPISNHFSFICQNKSSSLENRKAEKSKQGSDSRALWCLFPTCLRSHPSAHPEPPSSTGSASSAARPPHTSVPWLFLPVSQASHKEQFPAEKYFFFKEAKCELPGAGFLPEPIAKAAPPPTGHFLKCAGGLSSASPAWLPGPCP